MQPGKVGPGTVGTLFFGEGEDAELFLAPGARGIGAVYTNSGAMIHILRKVFLRVSSKLDWLIVKLH